MSATCFYPDGTISRGGYPCSNRTNGYTGCCGFNQYCASNGLCLAQDLIIYRGSCTDKTWAAVRCPKICVEEALSTLAPVEPCGGGRYSCSGGCGDGGKIITLPAAQLTLLTASTPSPTSAVITSPPEVTVTPTAGAVLSCAATVGEVAGVGAGIGVPLLLAFLGAMYLYMRERRRNQKNIASTGEVANTERSSTSEIPIIIPQSGISSTVFSELPYANHFRELEGTPATGATKYA